MIWVIGGTKDSRDFLDQLIDYTKDIVVTTATEYGGKLLKNLDIEVVCKKLTYDMMIDFSIEHNITTIVDLSHPYAVEVSSNAIEVTKERGLKYFRFERQEIEYYPSKYKMFYSIEDIIKYIETLENNILVTLGSNNVPYFKELKNLANCYFRILPKWDMVKKCEDNNILPKNIIAMQGPFNENLNIAMMEQLNIKYLITKQAGIAGGEKEKIDAAEKLGVEVIFLGRPHIKYPNCYDNILTLIVAIKNN